MAIFFFKKTSFWQFFDSQWQFSGGSAFNIAQDGDRLGADSPGYKMLDTTGCDTRIHGGHKITPFYLV